VLSFAASTEPIRAAKDSVPTKHEGLDRQHQRLDPQDYGVHDSDGIHRVKDQTPDGARGLTQAI
jgi:hypothetical protein